MGHVTVGIDGSASSRRALRFAAEEARLRGAELRVVSVWQIPMTLYNTTNLFAEVETDAYPKAAREAAEREIDTVLGSWTDPPVTLVVREGLTSAVLLEESSDAIMLVLGSRGRGGFTGLLLGSVSRQCSAHARCPTAIVHDGRSDP